VITPLATKIRGAFSVFRFPLMDHYVGAASSITRE
jgi:hypothetical protein